MSASAQPTMSRAQVGRALANARFAIETITPERAAAILATVEGEPDVSQSFRDKVAIYARSMARLNWPLNGDPIIFDVSGKLADGLARLNACVLAGVPFPTIVFYGVLPEAVLTLGAHLRRTPKDILGINGEAYPQALAGAWPVVVSYLNADDRRYYKMSRRPQMGSNEIGALTDRYPAIRRSAEHVTQCNAWRVMGIGAATAAHYLMSVADPEAADAFMTILGKPEADDKSALAVLAGRLANLARSSATFRLALAAKAWNRYRAGQTIAVSGLGFKGFQTGGINETEGQEAFPQFDGVPQDLRIDLSDLSIKGSTGSRQAYAIVDASGEVVMETALVTPAMAREYLNYNGPAGGNGNRSIRRRHVEALARDMRSGEWCINGKPLKFGRSGNLIDGQHRCSACVQSNTSFYTFIVRNLDDAVFGTFDTGERKGFAQQLKRDKVKRYATVAATVTMLKRVMENTSGAITIAEGYAYLRNHPDILQSIRRVHRARLYDLLTPSLLGAMHYLFDKKSAEDCERFFTDLEFGANLGPDDPLLQFRELLTDKVRKAQYPLNDQLAKIAIRTWNARRTSARLRIQREAGYPLIL